MLLGNENTRNNGKAVRGVFCEVRTEMLYNEVTSPLRMDMFAVLDKAKLDIENIRGLNLAVVKLTTVQVTKLPL
jgi:hypothetical protein